MDVFEVQCKVDEVVVLQTAFYGRMRYSRCVGKDFGFLGCKADVLEASDRMCSGQRACKIPVPNTRFVKESDCPIDLKPYFEATYVCIKGKRRTSILSKRGVSI